MDLCLLAQAASQRAERLLAVQARAVRSRALRRLRAGSWRSRCCWPGSWTTSCPMRSGTARARSVSRSVRRPGRCRRAWWTTALGWSPHSRRSSSSGSREPTPRAVQEGTGLGLALSRTIIEAHGARSRTLALRGRECLHRLRSQTPNRTRGGCCVAGAGRCQRVQYQRLKVVTVRSPRWTVTGGNAWTSSQWACRRVGASRSGCRSSATMIASRLSWPTRSSQKS